MFKIDFKNKRVDFFGLATYAKKHKLNHKDCLKQAFEKNALIEDNKDLLLNFIESFDDCSSLFEWLNLGPAISSQRQNGFLGSLDYIKKELNDA